MYVWSMKYQKREILRWSTSTSKLSSSTSLLSTTDNIIIITVTPDLKVPVVRGGSSEVTLTCLYLRDSARRELNEMFEQIYLIRSVYNRFN